MDFTGFQILRNRFTSVSRSLQCGNWMTSEKRPLCYIPYVILSLWLFSRVCVCFGVVVVVGEQFCESPVSICVITFRVAV